jgi:hypothetical protein
VPSLRRSVAYVKWAGVSRAVRDSIAEDAIALPSVSGTWHLLAVTILRTEAWQRLNTVASIINGGTDCCRNSLGCITALAWEPLLFRNDCTLLNSVYEFSSYLAGNTLRVLCRSQPVNALWRNSRCLLWEPYGTHRYSPYLTGNTLHLHYRAQLVKVFSWIVPVY